MRFQALVDGHTLEIDLQETEAFIDGKRVTLSYEEIKPGYFSLLIDHRSYALVVEPLDSHQYRVTLNNRSVVLTLKDERTLLLEAQGIGADDGPRKRELRAPMPGLVLAVHVKEGEEVESETPLLILEAMKMENELRAPGKARIKAIHVQPGEAVSRDQLLVTFD